MVVRTGRVNTLLTECTVVLGPSNAQEPCSIREEHFCASYCNWVATLSCRTCCQYGRHSPLLVKASLYYSFSREVGGVSLRIPAPLGLSQAVICHASPGTIAAGLPSTVSGGCFWVPCRFQLYELYLRLVKSRLMPQLLQKTE